MWSDDDSDSCSEDEFPAPVCRLVDLSCDLLRCICESLRPTDLGALVCSCHDLHRTPSARRCLQAEYAHRLGRLHAVAPELAISDTKTLKKLHVNHAECVSVTSHECRMLACMIRSGRLPAIEVLGLCRPQSCSASAASALVSACREKNCRVVACGEPHHTRGDARRLACGEAILIASTLHTATARGPRHDANLMWGAPPPHAFVPFSPPLTVHLHLPHNAIGGPGGAALAAALSGGAAPRLRTVNLEGNSLDDDAGLALAAALSATPKLRHMHLQGNQLGDATCFALATQLSYAAARPADAANAVVPKLKVLQLTPGNRFSAAGSAALITACSVRSSGVSSRVFARITLSANHRKGNGAPDTDGHGDELVRATRKFVLG